MRIKFMFMFMICVFIMCFFGVCNAQNRTEKFINSGIITLTGTINGVSKGDDVTIVVLKKDYDWNNTLFWQSNNPSAFAYYEKSEISDDGNFSFCFKLNESGEFNVYIGSGKIEIPEKIKIYFTEKSSNENTLTALKEKAEAKKINEVAALLANSRYELCVFSSIYEVMDMHKVAEEICKNELVYQWESISEFIEKTAMLIALNNKAITDVGVYKSALYMSEDIEKFYNDNNSKNITELLMRKSIADVNDYENRVVEAVLVSAINNCDGISMVQSILIENYTLFGITKDKVTDKLCSAIAGKGDFKSIDDVAGYIETIDNTVTKPKGSDPSGNYVNKAIGVSPDTTYSNIIEAQPETIIFSDIEDVEWAKEAIADLYYKGIVSGKTGNEFFPNDNVKREEFVKMIVKAFKLSTTGADIPFTDVSDKEWYYEYIKCAYLSECIKGISANEFGIGQNIIRQDLAVMVCNALFQCDYTLPQAMEKIEFLDSHQIDEYAISAVETLQSAGIIIGHENLFNPKGYATRAEVAKIIYMTYNLMSV